MECCIGCLVRNCYKGSECETDRFVLEVCIDIAMQKIMGIVFVDALIFATKYEKKLISLANTFLYST